MSREWSFEALRGAIRAISTNVRHFSSSFFWSAMVLIVLLLTLSVAAWRIRANNQPSAAKSSLFTTSPAPAAPVHTEAAIGVHTAPISQPAAASASRPQTNVTVDGHSLPLPPSGNGDVHKVFTSSDGATSVKVSVYSDSNSSSSTNSSLNLTVQSSSDSSTGQSP